MKLLLPALATAVLFSACATTDPKPAGPTAAAAPATIADPWRSSMRGINSSMNSADSTAGAVVPVLGSPSLAKEWGAPDISRSADGSIRLRYQKKGTLLGLICYSLTSPVSNPSTPPPWSESSYDPLGNRPEILHPQEWRQATVAGQSVRWFKADDGSGADFPTYSTVCFSHTDPSGRTGYYIVHAWSDSPENAGQLMRKAAFLR